MEDYSRKDYETGLNEKGEKLKEDEVSPAMKELIADRDEQAKREAELNKKFGY